MEDYPAARGTGGRAALYLWRLFCRPRDAFRSADAAGALLANDYVDEWKTHVMEEYRFQVSWWKRMSAKTKRLLWVALRTYAIVMVMAYFLSPGFWSREFLHDALFYFILQVLMILCAKYVDMEE